MLALFHLVLQHRQHLHDGLHQVTELWPVRGVKLPAVPHHFIPVDVISHYRPLQLLSLHHIISAFSGQKVCSLIFAPGACMTKLLHWKNSLQGVQFIGVRGQKIDILTAGLDRMVAGASVCSFWCTLGRPSCRPLGKDWLPGSSVPTAPPQRTTGNRPQHHYTDHSVTLRFVLYLIARRYLKSATTRTKLNDSVLNVNVYIPELISVLK